MTGVEILATEQVAVAWGFNWVLFWIIGGGIFAIVTAIGIWQWLSGSCDFGIVPALITVGLVAGPLFGCVLGSECSKPVEYTTEHKVLISDEVLMNEFNEKYEIVSQEGKIYTIRERMDGGKK